jgi:hypothetical protein
LTDQIVAQLGRIGPPIAATRTGNRVVLARMALGLGFVETANPTPAAAEVALASLGPVLTATLGSCTA